MEIQMRVKPCCIHCPRLLSPSLCMRPGVYHFWIVSSYGEFFAVAHGTEQQRTNLDVATREALDRNSHQYREAERELFGRELEAEDWDRMNEEERSEKTNELMKRLKDKRKLRLNSAAVQ